MCWSEFDILLWLAFCPEIMLALEDVYGDVVFLEGESKCGGVVGDALARRFSMCWGHR